jgi:hypothetical protein
MKTTSLNEKSWGAFAWALFDGLLIGVLGFVTTGHNEHTVWFWLFLGFITGTSSGYRRQDRPWLWPIVIAFGVLVGCLLAMIPGWLADPTAYNLWPISLIFIGVMTFPATLAGSLLANGLRRLLKRP